MNKQEEIDFFESFGLVPVSEDPAGESSISEKVYMRMLADAERVGGAAFRNKVSRLIDATDDELYLSIQSWDEL